MARPVRGWFEDDAFTAWRHVMCYTRRAKVRKKVKRQANRRERREARRAVREPE